MFCYNDAKTGMIIAEYFLGKTFYGKNDFTL